MQPDRQPAPHERPRSDRSDRPLPLTWPDDAEALEELRDQQSRESRARGLLWLPLLAWLVGTPASLGIAFYCLLAGSGPAVFIALVAAAACWFGAPVSGIRLGRSAGSSWARACYATLLVLSSAVPLGLVIWVADR